ncbi:thiamine pyrophosphate-dependent dehydrogenase E1 component subunit alpha [Intestinibacter sp.]
MLISKETMLEMYKRMDQARKFEEKVSYFFSKGMIHGTTHLSIGQEASGVAAVMALEEGDLVSMTHRGHALSIGMGIDLNKMMAELMGKVTGYCKGKGGSMHIADIEAGNLGSNGIVGGGLTLAPGAALTQKYKKTGKIVLCSFGDGASNEGSFHEGVNLSSVWKLPVIFYCENNLYGMSTAQSKVMNVKNVADRASSYGIQSFIVDGYDAIAVYETVQKAAKICRNGEGPVLVEAKTYRWSGHSKSDKNVYRTEDEIDLWREKDGLKRLRDKILELGYASEEELLALETEVEKDIENAVEFAKNSPDPSLDTLEEDIYAD